MDEIVKVGTAANKPASSRIFTERPTRLISGDSSELCATLPIRLRAVGDKIVRAVEDNRVSLPLLPEESADALRVATDPEANFQQFEQVIRPNPAMAAKLLRMANSPFYGVAREISSIRQAMLVLGTSSLSQMIMQLVVEAHACSDLQDAAILAREQRHAVVIGHYSQLIAGELGHASPEAFLCGLLHDFGKLVFPQLVREIGMRPDIPDLDFLADALHCQLGYYMASSWGLPGIVQEACLRHHDFYFNAVGKPYSQIGHIVACAERLAHTFGFEHTERLADCCNPDVSVKEDPAFASLDLPDELITQLMRKAELLASRLQAANMVETTNTG